MNNQRSAQHPFTWNIKKLPVETLDTEIPQQLYKHSSDQLVLVRNWRIWLKQNFTAHMPLLMATFTSHNSSLTKWPR